MKTLMIVTFGFLGLTYWELSGGAEFVPEVRNAEAATGPTPVTAEETPDLVTRASTTNILRLPDTAGAEAIRATAPLPSTGEETAPEAPVLASASVTTVTHTEAATDATGEATEVAADTSDAAADPALQQPPMVAVAGSRVNMRQGPGTDFPVIVTLDGGTEAEKIDSRDGWARIRVRGTGEEGWMAERLLEDV